MGYEADGIFVRRVALPAGVRGVTVTNSDGTLDIYINDMISEEAQLRALAHELSHARGSHMWIERPVAVDESLAADEETALRHLG